MPVRDPAAPNRVDERITIEVVGWARQHGLGWVSLAFAPFADLHETQHRTLGGWVGYHALHLLDPLIRVGSLRPVWRSCSKRKNSSGSEY